MNRTLALGYSPCPNDTFIFHALVHGRVPLPGVIIRERLEDVETLNQLARQQALDLTKISYHALGHLRQEYALLHSGSALGRGCGPLVVAGKAVTMEQLRDRPIAIPGELTTANLLLQLYGEGYGRVVPMPFGQIMGAIQRQAVPAGVIIHESRFTYRALGLHLVLDLGAWWETETGGPLPLGGILAKRSLGTGLINQLDAALAASIDYGFAHPAEARGYIQLHAQELDDQVISQHIALYVNDFSRDLGREGLAAVNTLLLRAEARGLIPPCDLPLFAS
jgi:1,4-dihydroxy-6-naphthoate synthase